MIVVERCEKKAGVFVGAKTYRLVLNNDGLYILDLGKAMGARNERNLIADKILDKIQENREKQREEKEKELDSVDLKSLLSDKKNRLLKDIDTREAKYTNLHQHPKLTIKSSVINITLHFWPADADKAEKIANYLNLKNDGSSVY